MPVDRVALYLQDAHSLDEAISLVQYAEDNGFEAVWQAESRLPMLLRRAA
jgi:5,10-methylenetetrahydromethanopterin reductase